MKKKNLIILLLIPFLISILGVVTLNTTFNMIDNDIKSIDWEYDDVEAFKVSTNGYLLKASGVNEKNYPAGAGNQLVWNVKNVNETDENVYAEIYKQGNSYFLKALLDGEVIITCQNEKGNVFRSMKAVIYTNGAIIMNPIISSSQNNIDQTIYYGQYDLKNGNKVNAEIKVEIKTYPDTIKDMIKIVSKTDNVDYDFDTNTITLNGTNEASLVIGCGDENIAKNSEFKFNIVENGVNVYTYEDLLNCTNRSIEGEIVVLRKSFESLDNAYLYDEKGNLVLENDLPVLKNNNVECFGNYNPITKRFNFNSEIYKFKSTYNCEYIKKWNGYVTSKGSNNTISDNVLVGLHVQKDFYGNGYTINMHNLTYPTDMIPYTDENGNTVNVPTLARSDLFRGALPFYTLGDHNNMPLVEALGQDNIGMYVNGNNILVNDINIKNCDFGNMLSNLNTVGTVVETLGNNITIKNSRLSNGRNVLRTFSSMNCKLENSLLSNSRNFLLTVGSNEYIEIDDLETHLFLDHNGEQHKENIESFFAAESMGDQILNAYLAGSYENPSSMKDSLLSIQKAFNNENKIKDIYKGSIIVEDTLFYQSGISAMALETMFNGPFLNTAVPSSIKTILGMLKTSDGVSLDGFTATHVSGVSYPVEVVIKGDTKFYDYKNVNNVDINGLITENISSFAASVDPSYSGIIDIDKIFPIKKYLISEATNKGQIYTKNETNYINIPVAYYGGGLNLSTVTYESDELINHVGEKITINFLDSYLDLRETSSSIELIKNMMLKAVTVVTGYEPFYFECIKNDGYLFGETPKINDLIQNAKGGN